MFIVLFTVAFIPFAVCDLEKDPSNVCLPDKIQFNTYTIETGMNSVVAMDFSRKLIGTQSTNTSIVYDIATGKAYVTLTDGVCTETQLPVNNISPQWKCLPAEASYVGDVYIGFGPNRVPAETWEYSYNGTVTWMAFSNQAGQPRYPILVTFTYSKENRFTTFYFNPNETISAANIFDIPDPCPPDEIISLWENVNK